MIVKKCKRLKELKAESSCQRAIPAEISFLKRILASQFGRRTIFGVMSGV
jgi:hypothetical protein